MTTSLAAKGIEGLGGPVDADELQALEARVQQALRSGDDSALRVLGYGEISTVLALQARVGGFACKRLPRFTSPAQLQSYATLFLRYLQELKERGVDPVPSFLQAVPDDDGGAVAFCVQPILDVTTLGPRVLAAADEETAERLAAAIVGTTAACASTPVGIDAQLSNWVWHEGALRYLDVTTPMLRDASGRDQLDVDIFLASLPTLLRWPVRAFVVKGILDRYHAPRPALRDLVANLHKEKLQAHIPRFLRHINEALQAIGLPAMDAAEAQKDYDADASTWALLQRLRRMDRWWQRKVRRRTYPFLLPGSIER